MLLIHFSNVHIQVFILNTAYTQNQHISLVCSLEGQAASIEGRQTQFSVFGLCWSFTLSHSGDASTNVEVSQRNHNPEH